jgi:hypothetical protein
MTAEQEMTVKHLEMIQAIISRLAQNSFAVKGWSITLVSAVFAVIVAQSRPDLVWITLIPTLIFWGLDAYYLRLERLYRNLYEAVAGSLREKSASASVERFSLKIEEAHRTGVANWFLMLVSPSVWPIPVTITVLVVLFYISTR